MSETSMRTHWRTHTETRAWERWRIRLSESDHLSIIGRIKALRKSECHKSAHVVFLGPSRYSHTRGIFAVYHKGVWIPIVYSWRMHAIITVLPQSALSERGFVPPTRTPLFKRLLAFISGTHVPSVH